MNYFKKLMSLLNFRPVDLMYNLLYPVTRMVLITVGLCAAYRIIRKVENVCVKYEETYPEFRGSMASNVSLR